jgi:hypothetical protein
MEKLPKFIDSEETIRRYGYYIDIIRQIALTSSYRHIKIKDLKIPKGAFKKAYDEIDKSNFDGTIVEYFCWIASCFFMHMSYYDVNYYYPSGNTTIDTTIQTIHRGKGFNIRLCIDDSFVPNKDELTPKADKINCSGYLTIPFLASLRTYLYKKEILIYCYKELFKSSVLCYSTQTSISEEWVNIVIDKLVEEIMMGYESMFKDFK